MNIHEYQAKELLKNYGVNVPLGVLISDESEIQSQLKGLEATLYVVKAQIHSGGRGKAGGVKLAHSIEDAEGAAREILGKTLFTKQTGPEGEVVKKLYIESGSQIAQEYYISLVIDRSSARGTFIVSKEGGVNIEEIAQNSPEKILKISIDPAIGVCSFHIRSINFFLGMEKEQAQEMSKILSSMYQLFIEKDASQIEINPLALTNEGKLIAADAKMNFDSNGLYRHPDIREFKEDIENPLEIRAKNASLNYIKLHGNIGCIVNGAGLAMATMDIIKLFGGEPANFLDVGGGATKEQVIEAFEIILSDPEVKGILVNIFGGIMHCDTIAEGIVAAAKEVDINIPLVVRLVGTNEEIGKEILKKSNVKITVADDLGSAAENIVKLI